MVHSSDLSQDGLELAFDTLKDAAQDMADWPSIGTTAFARRGGDGWQIALDHPALHLRSALFLQARLAAQDPPCATRIAVATGAGSIPGDMDLNGAHGPAFTQSGRLLEALSGRSRLGFATPGPVGAVYALADHIAQGWTQAQARSLALVLPPDGRPRRDAAAQLGISRQAVDQALWAAGYPFIEAALAQLEVK
ncbi:MarR family transcriptional regulator [Pseudoponticoccus marisrubri]|uniref:MarR family transcriptional regulator n=1 Tax=Pseudoponticoccus marisrubri TaxID=1685382 RepID=UPI0012FD17C1|nr:MarR family transcriptional regulator [Pseudoponticoccus marisrubri]